MRSLVRQEVLALKPPVDLRELRSRTALLIELDRLPRPFERLASPIHVTGSAIVVGRRGVVLHLHKRIGKWLQPGGHLEVGEAPWQAALREAREETGLRLCHAPPGVRMIHVDVHDAPHSHVHLDLRYLILADDDEPRPAPGESQQCRWFPPAEAMGMADEGLVGALRAAIGV
jgi:8-oxo-dGTP pyrophosphatase MutT (NUDIX family)